MVTLWLGPSCLGQPRATTLEAGGLAFSDELGSLRLISASGSGTQADPIVLVEEITGLGPAVLVVRQAVPLITSSPSRDVLLRSFLKIVINKSEWRWTGFDMELRGGSGDASVYSDGLSFDQMRAIAQPIASDMFAVAEIEDEPYDRLRFDQGHVEPHQSVHFAFNLVDINPRPLFYLAQEPIVLMALGPDPQGPFAYAAGASGDVDRVRPATR